MSDEHLIPQNIKDMTDGLKAAWKTSDEKQRIVWRLKAIVDYINKNLNGKK